MKTFLTALVLTFSMSIFAQVEAPQPSPNSNTTQMVGLSEVSIAYSRPSAKGRAVFGNLVPYNKRWRTGANENTIITFSTDVEIGEQALEAGSYAVYSTPNKELPAFFERNNSPQLIEIFTPRLKNDKVLLSYFDFLKNNIDFKSVLHSKSLES